MKWLLIILIDVPNMPNYEVQVGTFHSIAVCQEAADTRKVLKHHYNGWTDKTTVTDVTPTYALRAYCRPK